jgi:hypothetical protein
MRSASVAMANEGAPQGTVGFDASVLAPTLESVDLLARLTLVARHRGTRVELYSVSSALATLIDACGLGELLNAGARRVADDQQPDAPNES